MKHDRPIYLLSPTPKEGILSLPMIRFTTVADHLELEDVDTLMFTSKQAVKVADSLDADWKNYPCVAIGGATKKQIEALGGRVIYHPTEFYGEVLSRDIAAFFKERKLLYLRPREVSFDAKAYLAREGIVLKEQIIYETGCLSYDHADAPKKDAIIIFTSPSTIHCFFRNFEWDESYTAVVIGESTRVHLPKEVSYVVADKPLIVSCIEKAQTLLMTSNSK
jgi:uroporphyrinogen-III synthase